MLGVEQKKKNEIGGVEREPFLQSCGTGTFNFTVVPPVAAVPESLPEFCLLLLFFFVYFFFFFIIADGASAGALVLPYAVFVFTVSPLLLTLASSSTVLPGTARFFFSDDDLLGCVEVPDAEPGPEPATPSNSDVGGVDARFRVLLLLLTAADAAVAAPRRELLRPMQRSRCWATRLVTK